MRASPRNLRRTSPFFATCHSKTNKLPIKQTFRSWKSTPRTQTSCVISQDSVQKSLSSTKSRFSQRRSTLARSSPLNSATFEGIWRVFLRKSAIWWEFRGFLVKIEKLGGFAGKSTRGTLFNDDGTWFQGFARKKLSCKEENWRRNAKVADFQ